MRKIRWTAGLLAGLLLSTSTSVTRAELCDSGACDTSACDAADSCDGCGTCGGCSLFAGDGFDLGTTMFGEESAWDIGGWTQWGYVNKSDGVFNTQPNQVNNHQSWLFIEKTVDGSDGFDLGGRMDLIYGTDADNTQAFGNNPGRWDFQNGWDRGAGYGWALPQLYAEAAMGDLSIKAGHFYTLLGYEVVTAPGNFFFSHAFTMNFSEAFTHTGVLATYAAGEKVTLYGGWTAGWDTGFDQFNNGSNFLGGASVSVTDDATFTYILTAGNLGFLGDGYTHSIVLDIALTEKLNYVFQSDLVDTNEDVLGDGGSTYHTIGVNQYLFYTLTDTVSVGGRGEWWKANGVSYYETTLGLNYKPIPNFIIRPEARWQWSPAATSNFNPMNPVGLPNLGNGAIFGVDAILTF